MTAKQAVQPHQQGTIRIKRGPTGTVIVFADGDAPYWMPQPERVAEPPAADAE